MNFKNLIAVYTVGKEGPKLWNEIHHGGKDDVGSVFMDDSSMSLWEVKVRITGNRGRYLKIKSKPNESREFRASADGYKPEKYLPITPDEWSVFAHLTKSKNDPKLYANAQTILNRLV